MRDNSSGSLAMLAAIRRAWREHVRLPGLVLVLAEVDIGDRLPSGVIDAERLLELERTRAQESGGCSLSSRLPPHEFALVGVNPVNRPQRRKIPQRHFQNVEWPISKLTGHLMR